MAASYEGLNCGRPALPAACFAAGAVPVSVADRQSGSVYPDQCTGRCEASLTWMVVVPLAELPEESLRYAKRLSLISPEALYATKRAVNRGADAAGFRTALYAGLDVVGPLYATSTEFGQKFREIVAAEGVPAAVRWRAAQFKE